MKILHIIYDDVRNPWLGGGGAIRTREIYSRFPKKSSVKIVTGGHPNSVNEEGNLKFRFGKKHTNYLISRIMFFWEVLKSVRKEDYDLIVEDLGASIPSFSPFLTKKPVIASVQVVLGKDYLRKRKLLGLFSLLLQKLSFRFYSNFICVSNYTKKIIKNSNPNANISIIPAGVSSTVFKKSRNKLDYVIYLGRLDFVNKGIDVIIKSIPYLRNKKLKLYIIGDGEEKEKRKIKDLIKTMHLEKRVKLLGRKDGIEKEKLIAGSLAICLASKFEAMPLVLTESMVHGVPFVGSNIPAISELRNKTRAGLVCDQSDSRCFARNIDDLFFNKNKRNDLGRRGKNYVKNLTWDKVSMKQRNYYQKLLKNETNN